jgi:hypothetical protein
MVLRNFYAYCTTDIKSRDAVSDVTFD